MKSKLIRVVAEVRAGTQDIAQASNELADGNRDLAQRTDTEVQSIKEATASISSLTATVMQNAEHANHLALNAAVEAARAGEQGRGFAVVASDVRSLAQRSATAAQEIKQLIGASVERGDQGTQLVDRAGTTMLELVASIKGVSTIMSDITLASQAQSNGIAQVSRAIEQMNEVAQQNASLCSRRRPPPKPCSGAPSTWSAWSARSSWASKDWQKRVRQRGRRSRCASVRLSAPCISALRQLPASVRGSHPGR